MKCLCVFTVMWTNPILMLKTNETTRCKCGHKQVSAVAEIVDILFLHGALCVLFVVCECVFLCFIQVSDQGLWAAAECSGSPPACLHQTGHRSRRNFTGTADGAHPTQPPDRSYWENQVGSELHPSQNLEIFLKNWRTPNTSAVTWCVYLVTGIHSFIHSLSCNSSSDSSTAEEHIFTLIVLICYCFYSNRRDDVGFLFW